MEKKYNWYVVLSFVGGTEQWRYEAIPGAQVKEDTHIVLGLDNFWTASYAARVKNADKRKGLTNTITLYHPDTDGLSGTITELSEPTKFGDRFEVNVYGYRDWYESFEEAQADLLKALEYRYSGEYYKHRAEDREYEKQEKLGPHLDL